MVSVPYNDCGAPHLFFWGWFNYNDLVAPHFLEINFMQKKSWCFKIRQFKLKNKYMTKKEIAQDFLLNVVIGQVRKVFDKYVSETFIHHNVYLKGDRLSLMAAMEENAITNPEKVFEIQRAIEEGDLVAIHSRIRNIENRKDIAVIHIFKFENNKIIELWDFGQTAPDYMVNENGMF